MIAVGAKIYFFSQEDGQNGPESKDRENLVRNPISRLLPRTIIRLCSSEEKFGVFGLNQSQQFSGHFSIGRSVELG